MGMSFVAGWADVDDDGDPDLYLTNDVRGGRTLHGNALYRNDGAGCGGWCFSRRCRGHPVPACAQTRWASPSRTSTRTAISTCT